MRQLKIGKSITPRAEKSLDLFLQEIAKIEKLTIVEEIELAPKARAGNIEAKNRMTNSNLRFVVSVAKQYQGQGLTLAELISAGYEGLLRATDDFDETRGFKFISYAVYWIRQRILKAIAEESRTVRLPLNSISQFNKFKKIFNSLEQKNNGLILTQEIAEKLDVDEKKVLKIMALPTSKAISIDAPLGDDTETTILDLITSTNPTIEETIEQETQEKEVAFILSKILTPAEDIKKQILIDRFFKNMSLIEIAEKHNKSEKQILIIYQKIIRKIKNYYKKRNNKRIFK